MANKWATGVRNTDGTVGAHWTYDQTAQVHQQYAPACDPVKYYIAINMIYSDYGTVLAKYGVDKIDVYADLARAYLDDPDAGEGKIWNLIEGK